MPDWIKLVTKAAGSDLGGETVEAGVFVQEGGLTGKLMGQQFGGVAGRTGANRAQSRKEEGMGLDDSEGIAATLPRPPMIMAVTGQRVLFFSRSTMSGKPKQLIHTMPRSEVSSVEMEPKKATNGVIIRFSDDSGVYYDAPRIGNDAAPFVEVFD